MLRTPRKSTRWRTSEGPAKEVSARPVWQSATALMPSRGGSREWSTLSSRTKTGAASCLDLTLSPALSLSSRPTPARTAHCTYDLTLTLYPSLAAHHGHHHVFPLLLLEAVSFGGQSPLQGSLLGYRFSMLVFFFFFFFLSWSLSLSCRNNEHALVLLCSERHPS